MNETIPPQLVETKGSWLGFFVKLFIFLSVFLAIILVVLSALGGNSDVLKGSVEDLLGSALKGHAKVEKLHNVTFYPYLSADVEGVSIYETADYLQKKASMDRGQIAFGFWDIAFGFGRIKTFNIENFRSKKSALIHQALFVEQLAIIDEGDKAYLSGKGTISNVPVSLKADMTISGTGDRKKYSFDDVKMLQANLGKISLSGGIQNFGGQSIHFKDFKIGTDTPLLHADLKLFLSGSEKLRLKGALKTLKGSVVEPDLEIDLSAQTPAINGTVISPKFLMDDFGIGAALSPIFNEINAALSTENDEKKSDEFDLRGAELDLKIHFKDIQKNAVTLATFKAPLTLQKGDLRLGPFEHKYQGMLIKGDSIFATSEKPAQLSQVLTVQDWNYQALQDAYLGAAKAKGSADIVVNLKSFGNNTDEIKEHLNGSLSLVAGQGEFPASSLNFWGSGLLNALMPELDPSANTTLNCAIVDFKVEKGTAHANALFMDTKRVTLQGEGEYSFIKDDLDLELKPEPKEIAIGDIAAAIDIKGPVSNPSFTPDILDLGKKIGGLALGLVNPAFLALSLADLGLGEDHPCHQFIGKSEKD